MKKPRIQDIAQTAGVSPATVTRVLHGKGYVSEEKRKLVLQTAESLDYDFTQQQKNNSIPQVLIFSPPSHLGRNWLYSNIVETLSLEIQKMGYFCLTYYLASENTVDIIKIIEATSPLDLKGIIFNCLSITENFSSFRKWSSSLSIPVVMIERFPDIFGVNKIMINAKEAVFLAVRHLYKHGHRKIVFFSPNHASEVERSRIEGFQSVISAMELEEEAHFIPIPAYTREYGYAAIEAYMATHDMPTAIISADPVMEGINLYLYEHHIRVPEDISLIGLDDSTASIMTPALTSVAFPVKEIAQNVIQLLMEGKEKNGLSKTLSLSTYLIERSTVAPPRK